ncbi:GPH family glycoside/pentoside/hexuronide:cation symporter [Sphingomonas zeicaulis]|uniref:MFS transporter n=1 Tax=Sphingomonas zeicaulis TaxID=1632740 RepID=UPI003D21061B
MRADRLNLYAFALSHGGKSLLWAGEDALSLYTLIAILDVQPALAGLIFVGASFWNAVLDAAWGACLHRYPALLRRLPAISVAAMLVSCLTFAALPFLPRGAALPAVAMLLFRSSFPLFDVPHNSLVAELSAVHGHLAVTRWRSGVSALAAILIGIAAIPLVFAGRTGGAGAGMIFVAIGGAAFILLLPLPWLFARLGRAMTPVAPPSPSTRPSRDVLLFCLAQMCGLAAIAAMGKALLHLDSFSMAVIANVLLLLSLWRLAAVWLWSPVAARQGVTRGLTFAYLATAAAMLLLPFALRHGAWGAAIGLSLLGAAVGGVIFLAWSRFSELLERTGTSQDRGTAAFSYSLFTAATKIALGLSGLMTGQWIALQTGGIDAGALTQLALPLAALCIGCAGLGAMLRPAMGRRVAA